MNPTRRRLLLAAAGSVAFAGLARFATARAAAYVNEVAGYGPLRRDPAGLLDLPEGFSYTLVSKAGDAMSDGLLTPWKTDGMGCFAGSGGLAVLVRNHELKPGDVERTAFGPGRALSAGIPAQLIYDRTDDGLPMAGGTTTLVYDPRSRRLVSHHLSLAGTSTNCAGGITPWGSWLSCEETTQAAGVEAGKDHGWVFEVPSSATGLVEPQPIRGLGRFRHEAAAVDPRTGVIYLTEDEPDGRGLFYRFLPERPGRLHEGGRLQALAFAEGAEADPRNWDAAYWRQGEWRDVRWLDLEGVDNPHDDLRYRGRAKGCAWFARGEAVHFGQGELFFTCTSGGPGGLGQVMRYLPSRLEGQAGEAEAPGRLQLFLEPRDPRVMEMCDNLCVAPWGHLVVCEDKARDADNFLKCVTPRGEIFTLARNARRGDGDVGANAEFAGACFSPDGSTLFVNVYMPGATFAIVGPWNRVRG